MAIYHLEAKMVSRGAGRSAVAAAAYLSCSRMHNEYDGVQHDYTRKQGLGWRQVFLPATAPAEWQDRETLWNAVEETETAEPGGTNPAPARFHQGAICGRRNVRRCCYP